jgi:hypothetical protein
MMILTFNDTETPANLEKFEKIKYPTFFFGFIIRNKYDEKRLKIKKEFHPKYIVHKYGNYPDEMLFLYGLTTLVKKEMMPQIYPIMNNPDMNREQYEAVLNPIEVECNNCYLFLNKNLYPIDSFYTHRFFTKNNFKNISTYSEILDRNPELPLHHTIASFQLFLLTAY